jgi:Rieske Fe-S protein
MAGEDQERFEDYLELEHFIEGLQSGRVVHPPKELTPEQARIYGMATLFHAASSEEATPRPEFAAGLQAKLEQELQPRTKPFPFTSKKPQKLLHVSRRSLLVRGTATAVAAATVAMGVGIDHAIEEQKIRALQQQPQASWATPIVGDNVPSTWARVVKASQVGSSPILFTSPALSIYVIRVDEDGGDVNLSDKKGTIIAMSAHCTHQGCVVQWQNAMRKYVCPCHEGLFSEYGQVDAASAPNLYLIALPRLEAKIDAEGYVIVRVPKVS